MVEDCARERGTMDGRTSKESIDKYLIISANSNMRVTRLIFTASGPGHQWFVMDSTDNPNNWAKKMGSHDSMKMLHGC
jgi:hypothetical protein